MIKPRIIEFKILIALFIYGVIYYALLDLFLFIENKYKFKKRTKYIVEGIYLVICTFSTYKFCISLDDGYMPFFFLIFVLCGFLVYYIFIKDIFNKFLILFFKAFDKISPLFVHLLISTTLYKKIKTYFKSYYQKLKLLIKVKKKEKE